MTRSYFVDRGTHSLCHKFLGLRRNHLVFRRNHVPRRQMFPGWWSGFCDERVDAQRLLHRSHNAGFDRICVGGKCFCETILIDPKKATFVVIGRSPLLSCLFAFPCSARHRQQSKTPQAPRTPLIFGSAPSVLDRWWSSRGSQLPKCNFVLHRWSPLPHETTLSINKILRASPRPVVVRLITEQIRSFGFLSGSLCDIFSKKTLSGRAV